MDGEPFRASAARELIRKIVENGVVIPSAHARREAQADGIVLADLEEVLAHGIVEEPEFENGSWRYRVRRYTVSVVVAFRSATEVVVVSTWKSKR